MMRVIFALLVATYGLKTVMSYRSIRAAFLSLELCIRHGMSIEYCMERYIEKMGKVLSRGYVELNISRYDPYDLNESYWNFSNGVYVGSAQLKNIRITGLSNYTINGLELHGSHKLAQQIKFEVYYLKLRLIANCFLNGTLDSPINIQGDKLKITLKNLEAYVTIDGQYYYVRRKKYFEVQNVSVVVHLSGSFKLRLTFNKNISSLDSNQTSYLKEYRVALWNQIAPEIQKAAATFIQTMADQICNNSPVAELYPVLNSEL